MNGGASKERRNMQESGRDKGRRRSRGREADWVDAIRGACPLSILGREVGKCRPS